MAEETTTGQDLQDAIYRFVDERLSLNMQELELDGDEESLQRRRTDLKNALVENAKKLRPLLTRLGIEGLE